MEVILLLAGAAVVAAAGVAVGLALAPRLTRWDEARAEDREAAAAGSADGYDGGAVRGPGSGGPAGGGERGQDEGGERVG